MVEVLALEQQAQAEPVAEVVALGQRRRPAGVVAQEGVELGAEARVGPRLAEGRLQLLAGGHQRLGHEPPAEVAEAALSTGSPMSELTRPPCPVVGQLVGAAVRARARRPGRRSMKALSLTGSLRPGSFSTPVDTSTPHGRDAGRWPRPRSRA